MAVPVIADLHKLVTESEEKVRQFFEDRAPEIEHVGQIVETVGQNPLVQELMASAHIPPGVVTALADFIRIVDNEIGAAKSRAAAEAVAAATAPPEQPAPEQPAADEAAPDAAGA